MILLLFACASHAAPGADWELVQAASHDDINVYYRTLPSGNAQFKGVATVRCSLSTIVAVFLDLDTMPQWLYRTEKVRLLERHRQNELIVHMMHSMPFPMRKRDSVSLIELTQAHDTKIVSIDVTNIPQYIPPDKGYVRVPVAVSKWRLAPLGKGDIEITFTGYGEPGGSISSQTFRSPLFQWLLKQFLWEVPHTTLSKLRQILDREEYRERHFEFIQEAIDG